ncbi:MAG TPA: signal peptidase I [Candidatus Limnocylindria bacterium]|nr:signal peptidase I [Candidatus Limnocylindria bacterium]
MTYHHKRAPAPTSLASTIKELVVLLLIVFLIRTFGFGLYQVPTGSMETTMLVGERFFADKFSYLFSKPQRNDIIALNDPTFPYSSNKFVRLYQEYVGWPVWPWGPINFTKRIVGVPGDHVKGVIEDGKPVVYLNGQKLDESAYLNKEPLLGVWSAYPAYEWRSYVPGKAYDQQPFYRVNPRFIMRSEQVSPEYLAMENLTITPEGFLLKEPGKPIEKHGDMRDSGFSSRKNGGQEGSHWSGGDEYDIHLGPNEYWLMGDNRRGSADSRAFGPVDGRLIHGKILFRIWSSDSSESWWIVDLIKHPVDFWRRMRWSRFFQRIK